MILIEMLSSMLIIMTLAGNLFFMLKAARNVWQSSMGRSAGHHELHPAFHRIEDQLKNSSASLVTSNTTGNPRAFCFLSALDRDGNFATNKKGDPAWQKYIIYYIPPGETRLFSREVYGDFAAPLSKDRLMSYASGQGELVLDDVSSIGLKVNPRNNSAIFSITISSVNKNGRTDEQTTQETIFMRN